MRSNSHSAIEHTAPSGIVRSDADSHSRRYGEFQRRTLAHGGTVVNGYELHVANSIESTPLEPEATDMLGERGTLFARLYPLTLQ